MDSLTARTLVALANRYDGALVGGIVVVVGAGIYGTWWALAAYLGGAL